jgi:hypothetical protein
MRKVMLIGLSFTISLPAPNWHFCTAKNAKLLGGDISANGQYCLAIFTPAHMRASLCLVYNISE